MIASREELCHFYTAADVFVFPSQTDTFGNVILEAMACGLPVAAYPVQGHIDIIGSSSAGVLNKDLKKACLEALKIDRRIPRDYVEKFEWDRVTDQFLENLHVIK